MKLDRDFLPFYNKLIQWVGLTTEDNQAFDKFFAAVGVELIRDFEKMVTDRGLEGAAAYWNATLREEGAEFALTLGVESLDLLIQYCPSKIWLGPTACKAYCDHCPALYGPMFKRHGYNMQLHKKGDSTCLIKVTKSSS